MFPPRKQKQTLNEAVGIRIKMAEVAEGEPRMAARTLRRRDSVKLFLVKSEPSLADRLPPVRRSGRPWSEATALDATIRKSTGKVLHMPAPRARNELWSGLLTLAGPLVWAGHSVSSWIKTL